MSLSLSQRIERWYAEPRENWSIFEGLMEEVAAQERDNASLREQIAALAAERDDRRARFRLAAAMLYDKTARVPIAAYAAIGGLADVIRALEGKEPVELRQTKGEGEESGP